MAPASITEKRLAWKAAFDTDAPLETQLPRPHMRPWQAAFVMQLSESTIYDSCKRFNAAVLAGDDQAASREVPCIILGSSHRIPTAAFLEWFTKAGHALSYLASEKTA